MYTGLLHSHSLLRYFVLIMLLVVIVKSFIGWRGNQPYSRLDNKLGLYLVIFTHLQFIVGLILYFISDVVQFSSETMKNPGIRYWAVEHAAGMLVAIVLITIARSTSKRMTVDQARHRRLFVFNLLALIVIMTILAAGERGIFSMSAFN